MKKLIMTTAMILALAGIAAAETQEVASRSPLAEIHCQQIEGLPHIDLIKSVFGPATDYTRPGEGGLYKQVGWPTKGVTVAYNAAGLIVSSSCNRFKPEVN